MTDFPPTTCTAWEDCKHDGVCHDHKGCGAKGPNHRSEAMPTKCQVCHGKGYLRCDCWPGDCICAYGDEDCESCDGTGFVDDEWDDLGAAE